MGVFDFARGGVQSSVMSMLVSRSVCLSDGFLCMLPVFSSGALRYVMYFRFCG